MAWQARFYKTTGTFCVPKDVFLRKNTESVVSSYLAKSLTAS